MVDVSSPIEPGSSAADAGSESELLLLATVRVRDIALKPPLVVAASEDLVSVCRKLRDQGLAHALVRDHANADRLGIFTTTDLRDALLRPEVPAQLLVGEFAHYQVLSVTPETELVEALWLMVRHRVHRLLVQDAAGGVIGVVGQIDLVPVLVQHSHFLAGRIDRATTVAALREVAERLDTTVQSLHEGGARVERIAGVVADLNARLFRRLWQLVAPPDLVDNSCLLVMGSEGRGEQIFKTDQDNALLLRDGFVVHPAELAAATRSFNEGLAGFGYPLCPGDIMLTNPLWCQPVTAFCAALRDWVHGAEGSADLDGPMRLAIFFDAAAVAGDARLLTEARHCLDRLLTDNDAFLARFAQAADQFGDGNAWWSRLGWRRDEQAIDLKKIGIFPIVHGVRALSLKHGVHQQATVQRLTALVQARQVDEDMAGELTEALHFLMTLRLKHQLRARSSGRLPDNLVRPSELDILEREPLQQALTIVKRFRSFLVQHFRLDAL